MGPRGPPGPPGKPGDDVSTPESIKWLPHLKGPGETTPEGRTLVSVRAEAVQVVDRDTRDLWILDTARATLDRIDAMFGANEGLSADAALAKETYPQKADHWKKLVFEALSKLV